MVESTGTGSGSGGNSPGKGDPGKGGPGKKADGGGFGLNNLAVINPDYQAVFQDFVNRMTANGTLVRQLPTTPMLITVEKVPMWRGETIFEIIFVGQPGLDRADPNPSIIFVECTEDKNRAPIWIGFDAAGDIVDSNGTFPALLDHLRRCLNDTFKQAYHKCAAERPNSVPKDKGPQ